MSNELVGIAFVGALLWGGIAYALPSAVDKEYDNKQASVINHKYDNLDNQADLDDDVTYQAIDGKAYKVIDGLVSNEWVPLTSDGYIDDYDQSAKAKEIKAANESLKRIKGQIMSHQWAQLDHHDTKQCLLSDDEQRALIKAWQQSGSFDDVVAEIQGDRNGN